MIRLQTIRTDESTPGDQFERAIRADLITLAEHASATDVIIDRIRRDIQKENTRLVMENRTLREAHLHGAALLDKIAELEGQVDSLEDQLEKAHSQIDILSQENSDLRLGREVTYQIGVELED